MSKPPHAPFLRGLALVLALATGLSLAACQRTPEGAIDRKEVDLALDTLAAAPTHGFPPGAFNEERLRKLSESHDRNDLKTRDQLLYASLVAYGRAQHGQAIPKADFPKDWGVRPAAYDAEAELAKAVKEHRFKEWLESQPTPLPMYRSLQKAYVAYLNVSAAGGWPEVPKGLKMGDTGEGVAALRKRLAVEDAEVAQAAPDAAYDETLAQGVARFQESYGLKPTGKVDSDTLKALNVPVITRAAQIRANLERLRWLPRENPPTRVDVNTAAATFAYYEDDKPVMTMLSASGKPGDETPMLASKIDHVVLNPPWNVPQGIAEEELLPKEAANPGYFAANNYSMVDGRVVQQPGPGSALGLVKFDFDNPYAVYLHDTPSKAAFNRSQRAVSHGCVRLEHAVPFAKLLLSRQKGWSAEKVNQVLSTRETTTVALDQAIPVRLLYLTAFPENGRTAFRGDVYGWDGELLRLLDANAGGGKLAAAAMKKRRA